jgi:hypothetical protein
MDKYLFIILCDLQMDIVLSEVKKWNTKYLR